VVLVPEAGALVPEAGAALELTPEQLHMTISTTSPMESKNNLRFITAKTISFERWFSGNRGNQRHRKRQITAGDNNRLETEMRNEIEDRYHGCPF